MATIEDVIKSNFEGDNEVLDENGEIRPEVSVVDTVTGEHISINSGNKDPTCYKTEWEKKWEGLAKGEHERICRGDYIELKECLQHKTRHTLLDHLRKADRRRIVLLREHLIELCAYNTELQPYVLEIVFICTRLMGGDYETDAKLPDDVLIDEEISDSDEEIMEPTTNELSLKQKEQRDTYGKL